MAAYRSRGRGSLILDIVVRGIEIRRATGFPDTPKGRAAHTAFKALVRTWGAPATERIDLLQDLASGAQKSVDLWRAYRTGQLDRTASGSKVAGSLKDAWDDWIRGTSDGTDPTRKSALRAFGAAGEHARIRALPELLTTLRKRFQREGHYRAFNHYRALVQAFLRDTVGRLHPVYAQVTEVDVLPYEAAKVPPVAVARARAIRATLRGPHGDYWWALCITGLRPKEYFERQFTVFDGYLDVQGTKRTKGGAHSRRIVPLAEPIVIPSQTYRSFQKALQALQAEGLIPYTARHSFANWMYQAGITRINRDIYRGHSARRMEDVYEWHEVVEHVSADRARLQQYLARGLAAQAPQLSAVK